jgi:hypothetical protein
MMPRMEDLHRLTQARSLLILLLATCKQTQLALEAAANVLDTGLSRDLETMIERTESELKEMNATIQALSAK